ncbi:unnamed protein product [Peronospora belbahrii]|uniref:Uncharacterized protein n=1 Tax=Peronospora belbahrii TaxID=622444 RepID=A0ABN8DBT2_9STRA|nr:unnamed protein product [Peronospora belbahrii]
MSDSSTWTVAALHQCEQLLDKGTLCDLNEALEIAQKCRYDHAVTWYKKGLELYPQNKELQTGLKQARVAVLNTLLIEEDDDDYDKKALESKEDRLDLYVTNTDLEEKQCGTQAGNEHGFKPTATCKQTYACSGLSQVVNKRTKEMVQDGNEKQVTMFQAKMERVLEHFDVLKLARLAAVYVFLELLNMQHMTIGLTLLFLGLLAQAVMHRQLIMVISMLVICSYRSQLKERAVRLVQGWVQTSTDKLGVFTWVPYIMFVIPVVMKVFGQLKFMLFLQQDVHLVCIVLAVTAVLVTNSLRTDAGHQAKLWGEGRRLKFAAYFTTVVYWVFWRGQWTDTIRLLGPAFIDAGGIVLGSVTSSDWQEICRRAFKRLYSDVAIDIQASVDLDAWFFLGLGNWIVEYWQQPTDFSLEMLSKMLTECFDSMEKTAVRTFSPELRRMRKQLAYMEITDELQLLVAYLKQSLQAFPPPKSFGLAMLFVKRCPSFVVFSLLTFFYGVISMPLLPFAVSEIQGGRNLYDLYHTGRLQEKDGLELMLLDSPLVHVWKNIKGCIYCLEGSITLSKVVTTGTHIVSAAARISRLAVFASRVKKEGVFAYAHDIPDHVANVLLITKNSSLIIDGIRYIRDSAQLEDLQTSIANWWSGGHVKKEGEDES